MTSPVDTINCFEYFNKVFVKAYTGLSQDSSFSVFWESAAVGIGATIWTIVDSTSSLHFNAVSPSTLKDSVYYRAYVSCGSGLYICSQPFCLKSTQKLQNCYCTDNLGGSCDSASIVDFQINTLINNTNNGCVNLATNKSGAYTSFVDSYNKVVIVNYYAGSNYTVTVNFSSPVVQAGMYIDKNNNGYFDNTEYYAFVLNASKTNGTVSIAGSDIVNSANDSIGMLIRGK